MLVASGLTRRFPPVTALAEVDFEVRAGEVHALMGGNGAGKSTLIRILGGALPPDAGTMTLAGSPYAPADPAHAARLGVAVVHQEIGLVASLAVAEAVLLGRSRDLPRRFGLLDRRGMRSRARAALARLGLEIDVDSPLGSLPIGQRQLVAIARAVDMHARVLILDEPTSSLDRHEVDRLLLLVRRLRDAGTAVVHITHFLGELPRIADRVTVLRNGRAVGTWPLAELSETTLVQAMLGAADDRPFGGRATAAGRPLAAPAQPTDALRTAATSPLSARGLGRSRSIQPFDLELRPGEALGLAGLLGSGRTETLRLLFGADSADEGRVDVDGEPQRRWSPRRAIRAGVGFAPEDRDAQGLFLGMSVVDNIVLVAARAVSPSGVRRPTAERALAARIAARVGLDHATLHRPVATLSGGNRQKVVLARWLATRLRVLLLDEPTRGIDVGAKAQLDELIRALAADGLAIAVASSELDELLRQADRVRILRDRQHGATRVVDGLLMDDLVAAIAVDGDKGTSAPSPAGGAGRP